MIWDCLFYVLVCYVLVKFYQFFKLFNCLSRMEIKIANKNTFFFVEFLIHFILSVIALITEYFLIIFTHNYIKSKGRCEKLFLKN